MSREITHEWDPSCPFCERAARHDEVLADNEIREEAREIRLRKEDEPNKFDRRREKTPTWAVNSEDQPQWAKPGTGR